MNRKLSVFFIVFFISITGCGGYRTALTPEFKQAGHKINLISSVPQKSIEAMIPDSATFSYTPGPNSFEVEFFSALLASLLNASISHKATKDKYRQLKPLTESLDSKKVNQIYHDELTKVFEESQLGSFVSKKQVSYGDKFELEDGNYYLAVSTLYYFVEDFTQLEVGTGVILFKTSQTENQRYRKSRMETESIAKNYYHFVSPKVPRISKTKDEYKSQINKVEEWFNKEMLKFENGEV